MRNGRTTTVNTEVRRPFRVLISRAGAEQRPFGEVENPTASLSGFIGSENERRFHSTPAFLSSENSIHYYVLRITPFK
jgi:hypothetical protein